MSRVELPLVSRTLKSTGDDVVRAELDLELRTDQNTWVMVRFVVDSGTEMTTMAAAEAVSLYAGWKQGLLNRTVTLPAPGCFVLEL